MRAFLPGAVLAVLLSVVAYGQDFPARPVTIVSPYQAGGTSDIIARVLAQGLTERWGAQALVDNRPGANGAIGVNAVVRAAPDGHTLLAVASSALTLNPLLLPNLAYDVERDLAPVTRTGTVTNVLVAPPSLQVETVQQLVELGRAKPGFLTFASQGVGSNGHLIGEMFRLRTGIDMLHVPYKGSAPAMTDLLGGRVHLMFDNLPSAMPHIREGKLKALAVTTVERSKLLPDTPTLAASGLPGFDVSAWFAILVARETPEALRSRIESNVVAVLKSPAVAERLSGAGVDVAADGSTALAARIATETAMWRGVIKGANIRIGQ
jgi:tripartite-type tricarboxylate transporter receptor subunit TctC